VRIWVRIRRGEREVSKCGGRGGRRGICLWVDGRGGARVGALGRVVLESLAGGRGVGGLVRDGL